MIGETDSRTARSVRKWCAGCSCFSVPPVVVAIVSAEVVFAFSRTRGTGYRDGDAGAFASGACSRILGCGVFAGGADFSLIGETDSRAECSIVDGIVSAETAVAFS